MKASLLVTTSTALVLIERGLARTVHTGRGIYFGLTWDRDHIYIFCRNNLHHGSLRRLFGQRCTMEVLDKDFRHVDTVACPTVIDPHQAIERDGAIYVANTGRNRIEVYRDGGFSNINWTAEHEDVHHINTIWFDENSFYTLENNHDGPSNARIFDHDWQRGQTVPIGLGSHNIYRCGTTLYSCSSLDRTMISHDLDTHESTAHHLLGSEWLPRGLARGNDRFYIGMSPVGTRKERHGGKPGKLIATDENFTVIDTLDLDSAGQVNEVRLLSELDEAHNQVPF